MFLSDTIKEFPESPACANDPKGVFWQNVMESVITNKVDEKTHIVNKFTLENCSTKHLCLPCGFIILLHTPQWMRVKKKDWRKITERNEMKWGYKTVEQTNFQENNCAIFFQQMWVWTHLQMAQSCFLKPHSQNICYCTKFVISVTLHKK